MKEVLLRAVRVKHEAKMAEALANIAVYDNPVGIGEHPDLVEAVESQVDKYVHALEMVEGVNFELFLRCFCEVLRIKLFESANKFSEQE